MYSINFMMNLIQKAQSLKISGVNATLSSRLHMPERNKKDRTEEFGLAQETEMLCS